jgi:hypothetical protein
VGWSASWSGRRCGSWSSRWSVSRCVGGTRTVSGLPCRTIRGGAITGAASALKTVYYRFS